MSQGRTKPVWLYVPSRYSEIGSRPSRLIALLLVVLLIASAFSAVDIAATMSGEANTPERVSEQRDLTLYSDVIAAVRHGEDYYEATARSLRTGEYPLRPFFTFRLPTLAVALAHLPVLVSLVALNTLVVGVFLAWWIQLRALLASRAARLIGLFLLGAGIVAFTAFELAPVHEIWAGLLIALSLALRRPGRWDVAVAIGLAAALIRETASLYLILMMVMAWREGERREALGWLIACLALGVALVCHAIAVSRFVTAVDPASSGWFSMLGPDFVLQTLWASTALTLTPLVLAGPVALLSLFGWSAVRDPVVKRVGVTLFAYALLISVAAGADSFYWILLIAPIFFVGFVFVPDALRDLWSAMWVDKPRITVTRVSR